MERKRERERRKPTMNKPPKPKQINQKTKAQLVSALLAFLPGARKERLMRIKRGDLEYILEKINETSRTCR